MKNSISGGNISLPKRSIFVIQVCLLTILVTINHNQGKAQNCSLQLVDSQFGQCTYEVWLATPSSEPRTLLDFTIELDSNTTITNCPDIDYSGGWFAQNAVLQTSCSIYENGKRFRVKATRLDGVQVSGTGKVFSFTIDGGAIGIVDNVDL